MDEELDAGIREFLRRVSLFTDDHVTADMNWSRFDDQFKDGEIDRGKLNTACRLLTGTSCIEDDGTAAPWCDWGNITGGVGSALGCQSSKMEGFVDNIIRIGKEDLISKII